MDIENMSVEERIKARVYHVDYPSGVTGHLRKPAMEQYRIAVREREAQFRLDLEREHGTVGHPKASKLFDFAWREGHSEGYESVARWYRELVELVL